VDETFDHGCTLHRLPAPLGRCGFCKDFRHRSQRTPFCQDHTVEPIETLAPASRDGHLSGPKDIPETVMQGSAVAGKTMALLVRARGTETVTKELAAGKRWSPEKRQE